MLRLLALLFSTSTCYGALAFVQAKACGDTGVTNCSTASTAWTGSNFLYVSVSFREACASITFSITDGATPNNTFTQIGSNLDNTTNQCSAQFYAMDITGGTYTITVTASSSVVNIGMSVLEFSGVATTLALDTSATGTVSSSDTVTSGSFTTAQANEVLVCGAKTYGFGTFTAGSGYEFPAGATDAFHGTQSAQYDIVSSVQTGVTASFSNDGSVILSIMCATFKEAGGASPARRRLIVVTE